MAAFAAILVVSGACLALSLAWYTNWLPCGDTPESCAATPVARMQLVVAVVALVPAGLLVRALLNHRWTSARLWLAVTLLTYVLWGLLNDAAVHGWDDLQVFG